MESAYEGHKKRRVCLAKKTEIEETQRTDRVRIRERRQREDRRGVTEHVHKEEGE